MQLRSAGRACLFAEQLRECNFMHIPYLFIFGALHVKSGAGLHMSAMSDM